jgi:hypothetical protein
MLSADMVSEKVMESLIKKDYSALSYRRHCLTCHGNDGRKLSRTPIDRQSLSHSSTLSELYLRARKLHRGLEGYGPVGEIPLIFALRYARDRLGPQTVRPASGR